MNIFTMCAIPSLFIALLCLLYAAGSKKRGFLYLGYALGIASFLSAKAGML